MRYDLEQRDWIRNFSGCAANTCRVAEPPHIRGNPELCRTTRHFAALTIRILSSSNLPLSCKLARIPLSPPFVIFFSVLTMLRGVTEGLVSSLVGKDEDNNTPYPHDVE